MGNHLPTIVGNIEEGLNSSVYQNGPKKTRSRNASINASIAKMDNIHHKTTDGIFWKGTTDDEMDGLEDKSNTKIVGPLAGFGVPGIISLLVIGIGGLFIGLACMIAALHRVREGYVGVYFKNGALLEDISQPGIHWMQPFVTEVVYIRVTPETMKLSPMICTTQDGVKNVFRDVQVITSIDEEQVYQLVKRFTSKLKYILIYDRVREAISEFCANNTIDEVYRTRFLDVMDFVNATLVTSLQRFAPNGVILWNIFIPKPDVPPAIAANYRQVKVEWTEQLVARQKQETEKIRKETQNIKAILDAERERQVQAIATSKHIEMEEGKSNMTRIKNEIYEETNRMKADVSSYVKQSEANSNQELLTDQYVKLKIAQTLSNNTKMYFSGGDSVLGSVLGQVFGNLDRNNN